LETQNNWLYLTDIKDNKAAKKLLRLLNYNPETVQKDLEVCLQLGDTLNEQAKARASAIV